MAQRKYFRVQDLSGGLNLDQNPTQIGDNEATDIQNIRLDKPGSLVSRKGYSRFLDEDPLADILAIGRWTPSGNPNGSQVLAALADGTLRRVSAGYPTLHSGLDTAAKGEFQIVGDSVMYANGVDLPTTYNGTDAWEAGIAAPVSAPSFGYAGTGLNGIYQYAYTFYDTATQTESNPSPAITTANLVNQGVDITLPGTHPRADAVRIYRTDAGGTILGLLEEVGIATVTYQDRGSFQPQALNPLQYDNDRPLALEHLAYHKGYVFGSIDNVLYWSKPLQPEHWPGLNTTEVPFEGNDEIRGIVAYQDTLVVFGRRNIVLVAGDGGQDSLQWSLSRMDVETGAVNRQSIAEVAGNLIYLSHEGVMQFPQAQSVAPKLDRYLANLSTSILEQACLIYVPQERGLWLAVDGGTYTIHIPNRAISWYDFGTPCYLRGGQSGLGYPLFIDEGLRRVNEYGAPNDLGVDIPIKWRSKLFALDNPESTKYFRRLGAFASTGSSGIVTVTIGDTLNSYTVALTASAAASTTLWDAANWDSFSWAAEGLSYFAGALPAQTLFGHTIFVTVTADVPQETEIVGPITLQYREANRFL